MKRRTNCRIRLFTAIMMIAVLALPVQAASYEMDYLFSEDLHENEWLDRELDREPSESSSRHERNTKETLPTTEYQEKSYVTRKADFSFRVDSDATIVDYVLVQVPEGKTMTVDKGVTLTIYGQLMVDGKLVNNGTIILGDERARSRYDEYNRNPGASQMTITGEMTSNGTINIVNGRLENAAGATSTNKGTITITNKHENLVGIANTIVKTSSGVKGGHFINSGTINVSNAGGCGVRNESGATFENNGEMILSQESSTRGVFSGNKAYMKKNNGA